MPSPRSQARRLATRYDFGPRMATHHTAKMLRSNQEGLIMAAAVIAMCFCAALLGPEFFFVGPAPWLLRPAWTWWGQRPEQRRRIFLYRGGMLIERQGTYTAVPWSLVGSVHFERARTEPVPFQPRRVTRFAPVVRAVLKDSGRIDLYPVARPKTLARQIRECTNRQYSNVLRTKRARICRRRPASGNPAGRTHG